MNQERLTPETDDYASWLSNVVASVRTWLIEVDQPGWDGTVPVDDIQDLICLATNVTQALTDLRERIRKC